MYGSSANQCTNVLSNLCCHIVLCKSKVSNTHIPCLYPWFHVHKRKAIRSQEVCEAAIGLTKLTSCSKVCCASATSPFAICSSAIPSHAGRFVLSDTMARRYSALALFTSPKQYAALPAWLQPPAGVSDLPQLASPNPWLQAMAADTSKQTRFCSPRTSEQLQNSALLQGLSPPASESLKSLYSRNTTLTPATSFPQT